MTIIDQLKILDNKIKANKTQYDLDREAAKISALSSGELEKYEYVSSVKWGHLGHFDLEPNLPTNPMGSSGPLWARLYNNNYKNQNKN